MKEIKTRQHSKGIKTLDKAAIAGERMKNAYIRSKETAASLTDERQGSPEEYAGNHIQQTSGELAHDALHATGTAAQTAVKRGTQAFRQQKAKKAAQQERGQPAAAASATPDLSTADSTVSQGLRPQCQTRTTEPGQNHRPRNVPDTPAPHPLPRRQGSITTPGTEQAERTVEQGRTLAKTKARRQADAARQIKARVSWQTKQPYVTAEPAAKPSPAIKTRENARLMTGSPAMRPHRIRHSTVQQTAHGATEVAAGRSIKTAQHTTKAAIKTAEATARAHQRGAQAAAKAAKSTVQMTRTAAKNAAATAKRVAKATATAIKAIIAGTKALIAAIAAGGWVAMLVIVVVCLLGLLLGSSFGIFFSGEDAGTGQSMRTAVQEINEDYTARLDAIKSSVSYDLLEQSGSRAPWKEVLAIYAVKSTTGADGQDVASMTDEKKQQLSEIFWAMHTIRHWTEPHEEPSGDDTVTIITLFITVSHKTAAEMADTYHFTAQQRQQLDELLSPAYDSLWMSVLYGVTSADGAIVSVALSQLGNIGGEPYWSWYGFTDRVEWCACFVSWCANECGYIENGIIPLFSVCDDGIAWFSGRGQWADSTIEPAPGSIIFFDWDSDGNSDHVGIVERVEDGRVYTIEGNSGDQCRQNSYPVGSADICGYGLPAYP